jgi:hypothetical protein
MLILMTASPCACFAAPGALRLPRVASPVSVSLTGSSHIGFLPAPMKRRQATIVCRSKESKPTPPPPINLPSGLLLAMSSILAISTVGCIFELSGGHPQYGTAPTAAIGLFSGPSFLYLYFAAIKKGQAEAEED